MRSRSAKPVCRAMTSIGWRLCSIIRRAASIRLPASDYESRGIPHSYPTEWPPSGGPPHVATLNNCVRSVRKPGFFVPSADPTTIEGRYSQARPRGGRAIPGDSSDANHDQHQRRQPHRRRGRRHAAPLVLRDVFGMSGTKFGCGMAIAPEVSTGAGFNPSVGEHYEHRRTCA